MLPSLSRPLSESVAPSPAAAPARLAQKRRPTEVHGPTSGSPPAIRGRTPSVLCARPSDWGSAIENTRRGRRSRLGVGCGRHGFLDPDGPCAWPWSVPPFEREDARRGEAEGASAHGRRTSSPSQRHRRARGPAGREHQPGCGRHGIRPYSPSSSFRMQHHTPFSLHPPVVRRNAISRRHARSCVGVRVCNMRHMSPSAAQPPPRTHPPLVPAAFVEAASFD